MDLFDKTKIDLSFVTCHSGGAVGSDSYFESIGIEYGVQTKAYSYKTKNHVSVNKVEISDDDYKEGVTEINRANKWLNRYGIHKYMNLLARNWAQVKYSDQIFAIGRILIPGERGSKGYYNQGKYDVVEGGTGYAVTMGINHNRDVYVFDQLKDKWFRWSYTSLSFVEMKDTPAIESYNFAGIGTREISHNGIKAIRDVYEQTIK
jgi:hypothetical protein